MTTYTVFTMYKIREKMEKRKKEEKVKHGQITSDFTIACESNWPTAIVTRSCFFIYFS